MRNITLTPRQLAIEKSILAGDTKETTCELLDISPSTFVTDTRDTLKQRGYKTKAELINAHLASKHSADWGLIATLRPNQQRVCKFIIGGIIDSMQLSQAMYRAEQTVVTIKCRIYKALNVSDIYGLIYKLYGLEK